MKTTIQPTVLDITKLPGGAALLPRVPESARKILVPDAFAFVAGHPDLELVAAAYDSWGAERERVHDTHAGETIGRLLSGPAFADPVRMLRDLLHAVRQSITLECELVRQRDALDAELTAFRGQAATGPHSIRAV